MATEKQEVLVTLDNDTSANEQLENGLDDFGNPLTITLPGPLADAARKFIQRHKKKLSKLQHRMKKQHEKKQKKMEKLQKRLENSKLSATVTPSKAAAKESNEVQVEIDELKQNLNNKAGVVAVPISQSDSVSDSETEEKKEVVQKEEEQAELKAAEMPDWVRRRIRAAKKKGDKLPLWLQQMLDRMDDGKEDSSQRPKETEEGEENKGFLTNFFEHIKAKHEAKKQRKMEKWQKRFDGKMSKRMPKWFVHVMKDNIGEVNLEDFEIKFGKPKKN